MSDGSLHDFVQNLCQRLNAEQQAGLGDGLLLERWLRARDEAAFELLVRRHGPLVLGVCRRLLANATDVEDAFQATFLLLVRKAASIRRGQSIASWLYRVAFRVGLRARAGRLRGNTASLPDADMVAAPDDDDLQWRDLRPVLDEEVNRLPEKYRAAFVLCHLQGKTNQEAADALGCPLGTILSRLSWARERLRTRLSKRGIAVAGAALVTFIGQQAASAAVPGPLLQATLRLSLPAGAATSARAVLLAQGVLRAMLYTKLRWTAAALVLAGLLTFGTISLTGPRVDASPKPPTDKSPTDKPVLGKPPVEKPPPDAPGGTEEAPKSRDLVAVPAQREGVIEFIGRELRNGEEPDKHSFQRLVDGKPKTFTRLREGDHVSKGDLLVGVHDDLARGELEIKKAKLVAVEADVKAVSATVEEAQRRYQALLEADKRIPGTTAKDEIYGAQFTAIRYREELRSKEAAVRVARAELDLASVVLNMYQIRAPVSGKIKAVLKNTGEGVRQLEAVLHIQPDEK